MDKEEVVEVVKSTEELERDYTEMALTSKKKRSKAQEDSVERPKKPRSAYLLYYFDVHQVMQLGSQNMPQSEVNKKISESWKRLSVTEKSYYLEKAKLEKEGMDTSSLSPSKQLPGFRKILPRANCFVLPKGIGSSHQPEVSADVTVNGVTLKQNEAKLPKSYNRTVVPQTKGEATQVVTILPTPNFLEPPSVAGVGSLPPMMMISVGVKSETAKPTYKMSLKTYTRRGRGKCLSPGCSFMYVTRHKPSTCPECGKHLGGKWNPSAQKTQGKVTPSKPLPQNGDAEPAEAPQITASPAQKTNADVRKAKTSGIKREGRMQWCVKKLHSAGTPLVGSSTTHHHTKQVKDRPKRAVIHSQSRIRSTAILQKRPVRPILPALHSTGGAIFQIITVPPDKEKLQGVNNVKTSPAARESFSGLKPSTLKQLGQKVPTTTADQDSPGQHVSSAADGMNPVSVMPFKQQAGSTFDLGLSTGRGRGRCKNPTCDYVYKNRHKPAVCPKCGNELTQKNTKTTKSETLLDPHRDLSLAQREIQRQSTVQLLRISLQIPESEAEMQETLSLIQELNSLRIIYVQTSEQEEEEEHGGETETLVESGWPRCYESAATHCGLCSYPLFKGEQSSVAGQEDCWLLTETLMQTATLQLKVCLNVQCLALHSFTDLHPGLFNIGNRLLVSIDLFLKIRANIKLGQSPSQAVASVFDHIPSHSIHTLSPEESSQIQELLLSGYWAFECLTVRDYNDMICGICGIAPKLEIALRYTNNVLELKNVEFTWPECSDSDEVHVDDFWLTMESEAIEQAVFPADIPITRVDASIIAPFAPPLMRSPTVLNTEKDKVLPHIQQPLGDPSVLVRLIHDNQLILEKTEELTEEELRKILDRCGVNIPEGSTKKDLLASLINFYTHVRSGLSTAPHPPANLTAGKLSKVCPHQVVCSSKYLVRGETARDHVDLLLSSRYWPPVYVCDSPRQVALCTDLLYPELATQMWGKNQGCFSDPFEKPEFVSCPELQDVPYSADLSSVDDDQQVHPITKSHSRWLLHPPGASPKPPAPQHHSMMLCSDLEPYVSLVAELTTEKPEEEQKPDQLKEQMETPEDDSGENSEPSVSMQHTREQPVTFSNAAYYYLYNRLVDFLTSRDIVNQQISYVVRACQPGEVAIRDALYRLGVAQIKTE